MAHAVSGSAYSAKGGSACRSVYGEPILVEPPTMVTGDELDLANGPELQGNIAIIVRGGKPFDEKAAAAAAAGARGVLGSGSCSAPFSCTAASHCCFFCLFVVFLYCSLIFFC